LALVASVRNVDTLVASDIVVETLLANEERGTRNE